ncbi:MAG: cytochrome c [Planctomycetota bacterium]|nr:MAG: cytochrome c [Planctomycetota bacterium]
MIFFLLGGCKPSVSKPTKSKQNITPAKARKPSPERGKVLVQKMACYACHRIHNKGGDNGPDLTHFGSRIIQQKGSEKKAREWIVLHLQEPQKYKGMNWKEYPTVKMPSYKKKLKPQDFADIAAFLLSLK